MTLTDMLAKIQQAPHLDFGDLFGRSVDLFQKVWLQGLLMQVLTVAISIGVITIFTIPMSLISALISFEEPMASDGMSVLLVIFITLFYLVIIVVMAFVQFALLAGFYRITRMKDRNRSDENGIGFGMFIKKKYTKKILVLSLAQTGIAIAAALLLFFPLFFVLVPLQFAIIIFAFHPDWSVNDIYKAAFSLGIKKWGITFGLVIVTAIVAIIVGMFACGIGVYATVSVMYLPSYLIYKGVIGFTEDEDLIAQIGN